MNKFVLLLITGFFFNANLSGQITLLNIKNTPKAEYKYEYKNVKFNFTEAIHGGNDTVWNFSDFLINDSTQTNYFTYNPYYNSFPGYEYLYCDPPDPADTSYLRSDLIIYRKTDTLFSKAYWIETPPALIGLGTYIDAGIFPILKFPSQLNSYLYWYEYEGGDPYYEKMTMWKKTDSYGKMIAFDSVLNNLIRFHTYYDYLWSASIHTFDWIIIDTYEWYADSSELPLLSVEFKVKITQGFGGPPDFTYDTIAWFYTSKAYIPLPSINEYLNSDENILIYPCPALNSVNISSVKEVQKIDLLDVHGVLLTNFSDVSSATNNTQSINLKNIASGIYILRAWFKDKTSFSKKFVIKK